MSRESLIRATASALQPKGFDLSEYKQRSIREKRLRVCAEDAAGALAFAAMDQCDPKGEDTFGDRLAPLLLRLKYAQQRDRRLFQNAHLQLFRKIGRGQSETLFAVSLVALFEWMHDACRECRSLTPKRGGAREARGMCCAKCGNSGRVRFEFNQRWRMVSEFLADAKRARGQPVTTFDKATFRDRWAPKYEQVLKVLRSCDKNMAAGLDLFVVRRSNRATTREPLDFSEANVTE